MVEAQEDKWASAIWNNKFQCNKLDTKSLACMLEVKYLGKDGKVKIKCPDEHAYNPHADDILDSTTKAFVRN
ncbi:Predicted protein [Wolbachia endosymbiont strain TRS of Brugia malayi]|uniref:hypothetical protein n=1 Tax=Wolbachia endosymbiont of Brugia malayi TaxID=80849 RepID=UPI00004C94B6|nr:hypothetical protein [Wolbachia endosymbiont of Brugia malayi]AAW71271.1 Predicted protein [Wolbachia endosymbiont strain TRS of Brugia malayi]